MGESGKNDQDDEALRARLETLSRKLAQQQEAAKPTAEGPPLLNGNVGRAMTLGFRVLSEFVAAIIVGAVLGWQFDKWLDTAPALLIVFLGLGTAAGFWNVYRIAMAPSAPQRPTDTKK